MKRCLAPHRACTGRQERLQECSVPLQVLPPPGCRMTATSRGRQAQRAAPPGAKTPPAARCAARQPAAPQGNAPRRLPPRDDRPLQAGGGCSQQAFRFTTAHEGREHEKSALAARVPLAGDRGQPPGVQGTGQRPQVTEPFARHHTPGGDTEARTDAWWPAVALRPPGAWPLPCRGARKRARSHRARGASGRPRR